MLRGSIPMRISASSMSDGWIRSGLIRAQLRACGCIKHISVEYQSRRTIRGQLNPKSTAVEEVSHSPLGLALTSLTDQSKMRVWVCRKPVRSGALRLVPAAKVERPVSVQLTDVEGALGDGRTAPKPDPL